jgi:hypothetical protein
MSHRRRAVCALNKVLLANKVKLSVFSSRSQQWGTTTQML